MTTPGEARGGYEKYFTGGLHTLHASSTKEEIEECYDKWAPAYDRDLMSAGCVKHEPMVREFDIAIKKAMPDKPNSEVRVMDMGAGTGLLGVELKKKGYTNVDALDLTPKMLDVAKEKGCYTKFICAHITEARTPGLEDGEYDAIISSGVVTAAYGHIHAPAFYEMMRVIRDGGVIYFNVRTKEIPDFVKPMKELEDKGLWTKIHEAKVEHYKIDDPKLPKLTTVFAFQVHHKKCNEFTTPGEARGGYEKYFTGGLHTLHERSTKEEIEECYDKWAPAYDRDLMSAGCVKHEPMVREFDMAIKKAMPDKPNSEVRVMDMGAGTGLLGVELKKKGYTNVDALDLTPKMLDVAKEKGCYTKFICAHITEVRTPGLEDGEYDAIISSGVVTAAYGHIHAPAFYEMMRVIRDGGVIYFNVRTKEIPDFVKPMKELEDKGLWTKIHEAKVEHYKIDDPKLPKLTTVFAFQVHHKKCNEFTTPGEARGGYEKYFTGGLHTLHERSTKEEIEECYDKWAPAYDRDLMSAGCVKHEPMVREFDIAIKKAMPDKPNSEVRVMDMGAGTGLLGVELKKKGYTNVDALDLTPKMLDVAKEKGCYTKFICAHITEARTPGLEDGEYDAIISSGVVTAAYGHIHAPAFYEMMRVIRHGGVIYFNVRTKEIPDFVKPMKELEDKGLWTKIHEAKVEHYKIDDPKLPKLTTVFAFQVHHKKCNGN